ncbi:hypothetical protein Slin14017_G046730 [Septoria linicola]|nr:hypothetical protein Slin14017_G046730 [Septoria linicola]
MATTRQIGKLEVNLEQFSANNYVLEKLGKGGNAAVFATVSKAAVTKMRKEADNLNPKDQEVTAINLLLPELKATKVFDNYDRDSCVREVNITQRMGRHGNSSIVQLRRDSRWNNAAAAFNNEN